MKPATGQQSFFDVNTYARARRSDPVTSHQAAARHNASGRTDSHKARILAFVRENPLRTSAEIAKALGMERHEVARRLPDLAREGKVERWTTRACTVGEGDAMTWKAKDANR